MAQQIDQPFGRWRPADQRTPRTHGQPVISYDVTGTGPRVLMIMGFTMRGVVWRFQVDGLRDAFTLATFDNRGVGKSEDCGTSFTMAQMAQDALRVADAAGWGDFAVVGMSMGGMIAQELALLAPARVRSLALIATHFGGLRAPIPRPRDIPLTISAGLVPVALRPRLTGRLLHPKGSLNAWQAAAFEQRKEDAYGQVIDPSVKKRQLNAVFRHNTKSRLHQIRCPTLVVKPELDRLCNPTHSDKLAQAIPGATLISLPHAGHGLVFHAQDRLNQVLRNHLRQTLT